MMMVVRGLDLTSRSNASCTKRSLTASNELVASSSSKTAGSRSSARAIAMRCFCPPLRCAPRWPACVLKPWGMVFRKSVALAAFAAASTSSMVASCCP
mmetsp:Transcript_121070/g.170317  ORF Transcript_121070/g.170317 Transcript_121070/m.170317 type:complete len:98 (-) Transcript_121070:552-845(-)